MVVLRVRDNYATSVNLTRAKGTHTLVIAEGNEAIVLVNPGRGSYIYPLTSAFPHQVLLDITELDLPGILAELIILQERRNNLQLLRCEHSIENWKKNLVSSRGRIPRTFP